MLKLTTNQNDLDTARTLLKKGKVVAVPTDTVYGIISASSRNEAKEKIYKIKNRDKNKKLILLCSNIDMIKDYGATISNETERLMKEFWPGALTLILQVKTDTIGFRIPNHPALIQLIDILGEPVASTSANISNQPTLQNANDIFSAFNGKIAALIEDDKAITGTPSTIIDCTKEQPRIIREGSITAKQLSL